MEIESEDGERIAVGADSETEIGRHRGFPGFRRPSAEDHTVSRRHLSLRLARKLNDDPREELRASFEVVGRNPILVLPAGVDATDARVYRNSERGELRDGDRFSLSIENPSFWVLKKSGGGGRKEEMAVDQRVLDAVERRERRTQQRRKEEEKERITEMDEADGNSKEDEEDVNGELEFGLVGLDISSIDPVQEFGFLVKGHEFDHYPRQMIRLPEKWNWFLDEPRGRSDDEDELIDEGTSLKKRSSRRKKTGEENEDDDWTGDSEDETRKIGEFKSVRRSKYSTRSQDRKRLKKDDAARKKSSEGRDLKHEVGDFEEEEDETLGGFIVDDEDENAELDEFNSEDEEEEEFDDEEDDY